MSAKFVLFERLVCQVVFDQSSVGRVTLQLSGRLPVSQQSGHLPRARSAHALKRPGPLPPAPPPRGAPGGPDRHLTE